MLPNNVLFLFAICLAILALSASADVDHFSNFIESEIKKDKVQSLEEELAMLNNPNEYLIKSLTKDYQGKDWDKETIKITGSDNKQHVSIRRSAKDNRKTAELTRQTFGACIYTLPLFVYIKAIIPSKVSILKYFTLRNRDRINSSPWG